MTDTTTAPPAAETADTADSADSTNSADRAPEPPTEGEILEAVARNVGAIAEEEHLLGFYDTLREKILTAVEKRGGKLSADGVRVLLLVPDIFLLLVRLVLDREVPAGTRAVIGSVLAYFVLPIDLLPEAFLGGAGFLDDIVLSTAVVTQAFSGELEPYARKHWSGPEDLRKVLRDVSESAHSLLGGRLHRQLQRLLGKTGFGGEQRSD